MEVIIQHTDGSKDVYESTSQGWHHEEFGEPTESGHKLSSEGYVHHNSATEHILGALVKLVGTDPRGGYTS
jgi:hypothetical protein